MPGINLELGLGPITTSHHQLANRNSAIKARILGHPPNPQVYGHVLYNINCGEGLLLCSTLTLKVLHQRGKFWNYSLNLTVGNCTQRESVVMDQGG
jgi:hypothetical protein